MKYIYYDIEMKNNQEESMKGFKSRRTQMNKEKMKIRIYDSKDHQLLIPDCA